MGGGDHLLSDGSPSRSSLDYVIFTVHYIFSLEGYKRVISWRVIYVIRGHDKWSKRVTRWYLREGKRKRGRPQIRWDDDIRQVAGVMWNRVAQGRNEWKRLEEAFADWQTDLGKIAKEQILDEIKVDSTFRALYRARGHGKTLPSSRGQSSRDHKPCKELETSGL
ncbi:hypothetical protein EVAR_32981_1 [Eumeta japonica]|uniref:Uncharacterized protein n=1 Tax=Eumeta variegata TaxID=151549 RepID=A0A4C1VTW2_EUMVA|nr:hypothetical protein EVAR_32981_1 [Eumeta japonica]